MKENLKEQAIEDNEVDFDDEDLELFVDDLFTQEFRENINDSVDELVEEFIETHYSDNRYGLSAQDISIEPKPVRIAIKNCLKNSQDLLDALKKVKQDAADQAEEYIENHEDDEEDE